MAQVPFPVALLRRHLFLVSERDAWLSDPQWHLWGTHPAWSLGESLSLSFLL